MRPEVEATKDVNWLAHGLFFRRLGILGIKSRPSDEAYLPSTPPNSGVSGILATTITKTSGTTVTLANNAGASVIGATMLHVVVRSTECSRASVRVYTVAIMDQKNPKLSILA